MEMWKRWFRSNETIVLRVGGGPEKALVQHLARNVFQHASRNEFSSFFTIWRDWCPLETLGGDFFQIFGILFQRLIF